MTLHKTIDISRKFLFGVLIGIVAIFVFMLIFRLGVTIKNALYPPKVEPANLLYGILPDISFPQNMTNEVFTYELNTVTGELPQFPDRLNIYPINKPQPNLLNLNKVKEKVKRMGFVNESGIVLPETSLGNGNYAWTENKGTGRRITFDTVTFDFTLKSNFLSSPVVLEAKELSDEQNAIRKTTDLLKLLELPIDDVDLTKTKFEFFSIQNGSLMPETNFSKAKVIRLDLQQKPIEYDLNTGIPDLAGGFKKTKMTIPVIYPNPPHTIMNFLVASGENSAEVVEADFTHKTVILTDANTATYYIKTADEAFDNLKNGKVYIVSYTRSQTKIAINNVYLAYYIDKNVQDYLMPVIVFEGNNGFLAYVSAVRTEWVK